MYRFWSVGFRVQGLAFRVCGFKLGAQVLSRFRVEGLRFRHPWVSGGSSFVKEHSAMTGVRQDQHLVEGLTQTPD